jgi:hypothetical protein
MHWLQNLSQINADNINSGRCETGRYFRNQTFSEWYCEHQTGSKNETVGGFANMQYGLPNQK